MSKSKVITLYEFEALTEDDKRISAKEFEALENFLLANNSDEYSDSVTQLMTLCISGGKKAIKARSYVGLIKLKSGLTIEIMPKITKVSDIVETKRIFFKMLSTLYDIPYKISGTGNIDANETFLEFYIRMFITNVSRIIKRGVISGYKSVDENNLFLRGRLLVSQNIRENYIHKERFFTSHDVLSPDRAENRLIKSACELLKRRTHNSKNHRDLCELCILLDEIPFSKDPASDFSLCQNIRISKEYKTAIDLCKIFLQNKSFSTYSGKYISYALLFPMEKVFEAYAAKLIKQKYADHIVKTQIAKKHLFVSPKKFLLRPDIALYEKSNYNNTIMIIDTKWKMLDDTLNSVSQADMYQMFAYAKLYGCKKICLLYPAYSDNPVSTEFHTEDDITVSIRYLDLINDEITPEIKLTI